MLPVSVHGHFAYYMVKFFESVEISRKILILFLKWKKWSKKKSLAKKLAQWWMVIILHLGFLFPFFHIPSPILGGSKHVFLGQFFGVFANFFFLFLIFCGNFVEILVSKHKYIWLNLLFCWKKKVSCWDHYPPWVWAP